jgi:hypothetical protein
VTPFFSASVRSPQFVHLHKISERGASRRCAWLNELSVGEISSANAVGRSTATAQARFLANLSSKRRGLFDDSSENLTNMVGAKYGCPAVIFRKQAPLVTARFQCLPSRPDAIEESTFP